VKLANLEIIRFNAALLVVAFHSISVLEGRGYNIGFLEDVYFVGQAGVDLFFVVSGFVIYLSLSNSPKNSWSFLKSRIRRILPSYWLITLLTVGAWAITRELHISTNLTPIKIDSLIQSLSFTRGLVGNSKPIVIPGWTLELEMLFYVAVSISLLIKKQFFIIVFSLLALLISIKFFGVSGRAIEFIIGMLIAVCFLKWKVCKSISLGIVSIGLALLLLSMFGGISGVASWKLWALSSSAIVFGTVQLPQTKSSIAMSLGAASYSVYLVQWFTIPATAAMFGLVSKSPFAISVYIFICLVVTQTVGFAYYQWLEKPALTWLKLHNF